MLEDAESKRLEREGRESWVERPNEILVEPLRFLDLKADPFHGFKFFSRQVDNEADAEVIEPYSSPSSAPKSLLQSGQDSFIQSSNRILVSVIMPCEIKHLSTS